jgi:asparagine synthase (glutamine-hydrolysing)
LERFVGIYTIFNDDLKKDMYAREMECLVAEDQSHYFEQAMARADKTNGSLSKLLYIDTHTMLADDLLLFNDKITMAHSIENRVPYLDKDLLNFIESLPIEFKLNGTTRKYLHREAVKGMIPPAIINRKKKGFATPVDEWFQNELSDSLHDMVNSKDSFSGSFFNLSAINQMIFKHKTKKRNYKHELFMLLSLEVWFKEFYQIF